MNLTLLSPRMINVCNAVAAHTLKQKRVYVFYKYASEVFTCRSNNQDSIDRLMYSDDHGLVGAFISVVKPETILERVQSLTEEVRV